MTTCRCGRGHISNTIPSVFSFLKYLLCKNEIFPPKLLTGCRSRNLHRENQLVGRHSGKNRTLPDIVTEARLGTCFLNAKRSSTTCRHDLPGYITSFQKVKKILSGRFPSDLLKHTVLNEPSARHNFRNTAHMFYIILPIDKKIKMKMV